MINNEIYKRAEKILKETYGNDAHFRDGQYDAIEKTMTKRRTLVVQRTGWGKSLVYFICTKMFRELNKGITMVISPLLVLMDNQAATARKMGIKCDVLNSTVKDRREDIINQLINNEIDLIFVTPETLFKDDMQQALGSINIGLFVVDEAHCISDWGHDFRLEYGKVGKIIAQLPSNISVLATTATANDRVIADLKKQFDNDLYVLKGPLTRDSLHIQILKLKDKVDRYAWILENINKLPGTGVIYCLTRRDCDYLAKFLNENGISALPYYSNNNLTNDDEITIKKFQNNEIKVLVATIKLGMGYDKGDISFIIHYQSPSNIVEYYQQIGRAGRNIPDAYVFLMVGKEDEEINNYFINTAFPTEKETKEIIESVSKRNGSKKSEIISDVNISYGRINKAIDFLLSDGYIYLSDRRYYLSPKPFFYDKEHYDEITKIRKKELMQMKDYYNTTECYSKYAVNCLDDFEAKNCNKCANCLGHDIWEGLSLSLSSKDIAADYINAQILTITPRKKWPDLKNIKHICCPGICLSRYKDPGYGQLVKEGKYGRRNIFCDELVGKSKKTLLPLVKENNIKYITNIPSDRSNIVEDFTKRLANSMGLNYIDSLDKLHAKQQKEMENSSFQCENAFNSFLVKEDFQPVDKIILVDDIVDSGWTLTVCGYKLAEKGCNEIFPFALADSSDNKG